MITGRFAPTPSGPLHFGSLIAAIGSYLNAKSRNGQWLVRIDDLDTPRTVPGSASSILFTLESFGLHWDGEVIYQSHRHKFYLDALSTLKDLDLTYLCACSRKETGNSRYPGTCREGLPPGRSGRSIRLRTDNTCVEFQDHIQGLISQNIDLEVGDFVIERADHIIAYHLATVVDDAWQNVTEIVRGADLLDSTPRQIYLQRLLNLPEPDYYHLPVAVDEKGIKLSKSNGSITISQNQQANYKNLLIYHALEILGQSPPRDLIESSVTEGIAWALDHWNYQSIPDIKNLPLVFDYR